MRASSRPARPSVCHEWLFDLRESGRLAEAAWDGFLKVRKLGDLQDRTAHPHGSPSTKAVLRWNDDLRPALD